MNENYYIELYKAKKMYIIVRNALDLINKVSSNPVIKNNLKTELNKILQYLTLKQLKVVNDKGELVSDGGSTRINEG